MNQDMRLSQEIESFIIGQGADAVGIAPLERFEKAPEGYGPQDYMPDATCVISIALHLADGVCDVWGEYSQPGKSISPYLFYGYGLTNLELARIANLTAKRLEYKGYKSLTFPPTWTISLYRSRGLGHPNLLADFSHRHAAVAAGLGEFGWNGLAINPSFGTRVRFNSVITNAPLVPSPMYQGTPLCQPDRCKYLCVKECPAQAFSATESQQVEIGGRAFEYAQIDKIRCMYGIFALAKGSGCYGGVEIPPGPGNGQHFRQARENQDPRDRAMLENVFGIICGDFCGKCLHQCPAHIYARTGVAPRRAR